MPKKLLLLIFLLLVVSSTSFAQDDPESTPEPEPPDLAAVCRNAVDGIAALHANRRIPDHLMEENPVKTEADFDVNRYFDVLDHLSVQEGYALDYVYIYDGMGGYPILYAYPDDEAPYQTGADYRAANEYAPLDYLAAIVTDDTPESYLQLAVLEVMGNQFYLYWHANYNDAEIICDQDMLEAIIEPRVGDSDYDLNEEAVQKAGLLRVTPVVEFDDEVAHLWLVLFTDWGGFYHVGYTIGREFPREAMEVDSEQLVPYNCDIMF